MEVEMQSIWEAMKGPHYQRILRELEAALANTEDLTQALTIALNKVVQAAHAEAGTCWFYDYFGDKRIRALATYGGKSLEGFSLALGEGIAGLVIADGRSVIIPDCRHDPHWDNKADHSTGFRTLSMVCVPLCYQENVFGCIQLINRTDSMSFDEKDLAFAEDLGSRAARLFEQRHLLGGYTVRRSIPDSVLDSTGDYLFSKLFSMKTFAEVEETLLSLKGVQQLRETEQKHLLRLSREMWMIFSKNG